MKSSWVVIPTTMGTFLMHIIAAIIEKAILYSTLSNVCMVLSQQIVYMAMFSRSVIRIKTIRNWHGVYVFPICKLAINRFMSSSNQECTDFWRPGRTNSRVYISRTGYVFRVPGLDIHCALFVPLTLTKHLLALLFVLYCNHRALHFVF